MTDDQDVIRRAVREAVHAELPLAIGEALAPLIHSAVRSDMRWWRRYALAGYLVLALGLGYVIHDNRDTGSRTSGALCALRHDLEERVAGGETFLREHPHGIPGIPAATLRVSLDGQQRTIAALAGLNCPPPPDTP